MWATGLNSHQPLVRATLRGINSSALLASCPVGKVDSGDQRQPSSEKKMEVLGTSLVVPWLRLQKARVQSLVWESDPTGHTEKFVMLQGRSKIPSAVIKTQHSKKKKEECRFWPLVVKSCTEVVRCCGP